MGNHSSEKIISKLIDKRTPPHITTFPSIIKELFMTRSAQFNYKLIKTIGTGSYGRVLLAENKTTQELVAIKRIKLVRKIDYNNCYREIQIMNRSNHPNIVKFKSFIFLNATNSLLLVMEYIDGGTLYSLIKRFVLNEKQIRFIMQQILLGLAYLHSKVILLLFLFC